MSFFPILVLFAAFAVSLPASGTSLSADQNYTIEGQLYNSGDNSLLESTNVSIELQVVSSANTSCVLYEEEFDNLDLSATGSEGRFSVQLGSGTQISISGGSTLTALFESSSQTVTGTNGGATCTVTLTGSTTRMIRTLVKDVAGGASSYETLSPDTTITAVPYASTLQGKSASDFLQMNTTSPADLSQANLENVFSTANYTKLTDLLSGSSTQYMSAAPTSPVGFNSQQLTNVADPTSAQDAATKNYTDNYIAGLSSNVSGLAAGTGNGEVLTWDGVTGQWIAQTPSTNDATKLPLTGGTMTGPIDMGSQDITSTGYITMSADRYIQVSNLSGGQESTLTATPLTSSNAGAMWYNTTDNVLKIWNGTSAQAPVMNGGQTGAVTTGPSDSNALTLQTNATARMTIDASGNIGVGTTTPAARLDVNGAIRIDAATAGSVTLQASSSSGDLAWTLPNADGTSGQVLSTNGAGQLSWTTTTAGTVTSVASANSDISVANSTTTPVLTLNSGTSANQIIKLDSSAKLPAVDGSQLTNINATKLQSNSVSTAAPSDGQVLTWSVINSDWEPMILPPPSGTAGGDLTGSYPSPTIANGKVTTTKMFSNPGVNRLVATNSTDGSTLAPFSCASGETLQWGTSGWACTSVSAMLGTSYLVNGGQTGTVTAGPSNANTFTLQTNGTARLTINAAGAVGIGTSTPAINTALDVNGDVRVNHLSGAQSTVPTCTVGPGISTTGNGTCTIFSGTGSNGIQGGSDLSHVIQVGAPTGCSASTTTTDIVVTVTFAHPFANPPTCVFSPGNSITASELGTAPVYIETTTTQYTLKKANSTALFCSTFEWHVHCID